MPWSGYRFDLIMDCTSTWIDREKKSLLALLDMLGCGFVDEAEGVGIRCYIDDLAQVQRPQTESMNLHGNDLAHFDSGARIRNAHPTEVELSPSFKGPNPSLKDFWADAQLCPRAIVC
jgi:hypothetical protein